MGVEKNTMVNSWFGAAGENSTDQFNQQNETLHSAAGRGDSKMLQTLSSQKANIDALDAAGYTALHRAVWNARNEATHLLIEMKADVNAVGKDGRRPLHEAALRNHPQLVDLLCEKGADVNVKTNDGNTPLNYAANGSHQAAEFLLNAGHPDLANTQDRLGNTPLHRAVSKRDTKMAGLLLAGRADVNETTTVTTAFASLLLLNSLVDGQAGKTPLDFAHHLKDAAMIRML